MTTQDWIFALVVAYAVQSVLLVGIASLLRRHWRVIEQLRDAWLAAPRERGPSP